MRYSIMKEQGVIKDSLVPWFYWVKSEEMETKRNRMEEEMSSWDFFPQMATIHSVIPQMATIPE